MHSLCRIWTDIYIIEPLVFSFEGHRSFNSLQIYILSSIRAGSKAWGSVDGADIAPALLSPVLFSMLAVSSLLGPTAGDERQEEIAQTITFITS